MITFLKAVGIIILLFFGTAILSAASPQLGLYVAIAFLVVPAIAIIKPIPKLKLGHRGFSLAVILFVGLPATIATTGIVSDQREANFAALKETDPSAYLAALKDYDQSRWIAELKTIDPEQHAIEVARIAEEEVRRREEEAKQQEEERVAAEAEAKQRRLEECGEKNESMAFVMSQEFVKRRLRAPATADFPSWPSEYRSQAIGDCKYQVITYVDAQNGFGALIRSRYSATMLLHPDEGSWSALEVNMSE